jgi:WD40 repeat protein
MRTGLQRFCLLFITGLVLIGADSPTFLLAKDELRAWADTSGKNKIKAKFIKLDDGVVTLEKEDGDEVEIELKKLSPADQKFIAEAVRNAEDNPFKSKSEDPFKAKPKGKKPASSKADDDDSDGPRTVKVDLSSADQISLGAPSDEWHVEVTSAEPRSGSGKQKPVPLPAKTNFFEGLKGLAFSRGEKNAAVVGFLTDKPGDASTTRVALCDLATGKCGTPAVAAAKMTPIALHDDGRQIVMRREEFGFGNQDRLEVWTIKGTKIAKSVTWVPYDADQGAARDVLWAEFIDPDRLATSSRDGKVVLWKFPAMDPICQWTMVNGAVPALSSDRKLLAYCTGKEIGLFDVQKLEVIAQQATPSELQWPLLAFSPSGKRLGCVAFDKVLVWDLATGKLEKTIPCAGIQAHGSIGFPDDNFILVGNKFLIDVENQLKLWTYEGAEQVRSIDGLTYFAMTDGEKKPGALIAAQLPHSAARDQLKKALSDPNLFVLKAGTTVRIDVSGIPDASQRDRVLHGLGKRLEAIDCKAGPTGTIDIVASVAGPKDRKIRFIQTGEYNFKEYVGSVKFVYQNQPVWETSSSNTPFFVQLKAGENMEGHLREREKPGYDFFDQVQLPRFLQKPVAGQAAGNSLTLGQSKVTVGGIR